MKRAMTGTTMLSGETPASNEQGWALLGLLLALGVMSMLLVSTVVPNVQMQVQRDKEVEMIYRGEQMAAGIARYYNSGRLAGIYPNNINNPPLYGALKELAKLKDGVTIGVQEIKLVRSSAMIDPMINGEWEPVRLRDPRILKFLMSWSFETGTSIDAYLPLAAAPLKSVFRSPGPNQPGVAPPAGEVEGQPTPPNVINPPPPGRLPNRPNPNDDADDDDDADSNDPFRHFFSDDQPGHSNFPIIGVAPRRKGTATRPYYGLDQYEDWIFIYIPRNLQPTSGGRSGAAGGGRRQISQ